jgi:hypothetical protein
VWVPWDAATLRDLAHATEVRIEVPAPEREPIRVPVWLVTTGDQLYLRSWKGDAGAWYRRARRFGEGTLLWHGRRYAVRFVPVSDPDIEAAIDKQYLAKYRRSRYAEAMTRPPATGTTLRLDRLDS